MTRTYIFYKINNFLSNKLKNLESSTEKSSLSNSQNLNVVTTPISQNNNKKKEIEEKNFYDKVYIGEEAQTLNLDDKVTKNLFIITKIQRYYLGVLGTQNKTITGNRSINK